MTRSNDMGPESGTLLTINHLPPEVLAAIFHTYMFCEGESVLIDPGLEGMVSVFLPGPRSAPLLFCGVCSYWRNVAISTPALWAAIAIRQTFHLGTVELWLQRSQNHPLSLFVSLDCSVSPEIKPLVPRLLETLYGHIPRWQQVSIRLPKPEDTYKLVFTLIPNEGESSAVLLQNLQLSREYRESAQLDPEALARLSSFPHSTLRRFSWSGFTTPDPSHMSTTLWTNLQQVSLEKTTTGSLYLFLKTCRNIRHLNINALHTVPDDPSGLPIKSTTARNLQTLNVGFVMGNLMSSFEFLRTPNLKRLSFQHNGYPRGQITALQGFLERSGCNLRSLFIVCKWPSFDEAETEKMMQSSVFTSIPHLSLRISEKACDPTFPQAIISETLPQLQLEWRATAYARYEPKNRSYHLGWGTLDLARMYNVDYPFLVKDSKPSRKWAVSLSDGPWTCA
ncbi:hypothetical protein CVT24_012876 [Panaeolus cyanescens]|uniref:Uncharacterized protein n=1 Tax=Panaeolus cyanescens TaxID=181874 RepID=A0A409W6P1_9AGAR|nr:hypothetical protein CVT24_012876 [Panaeolus cyanescens]